MAQEVYVVSALMLVAGVALLLGVWFSESLCFYLPHRVLYSSSAEATNQMCNRGIEMAT